MLRRPGEPGHRRRARMLLSAFQAGASLPARLCRACQGGARIALADARGAVVSGYAEFMLAM
jgi:hypothetical protein